MYYMWMYIICFPIDFLSFVIWCIPFFSFFLSAQQSTKFTSLTRSINILHFYMKIDGNNHDFVVFMLHMQPMIFHIWLKHLWERKQPFFAVKAIDICFAQVETFSKIFIEKLRRLSRCFESWKPNKELKSP